MTLINIDWSAVLVVVASGVVGAVIARGIAWHSTVAGRRKADLAIEASRR